MLTDVLTVTGKDIWVTMRRRSIVTALALFTLLVGLGSTAGAGVRRT